MENQEVKFVERVEQSIMQFVILHKCQQGEVTRQNLQQVFRGEMTMKGDHFEHCITTLVEEGHIEEKNGKYTITDDGREDLSQLEGLVMRLPEVVETAGTKASTGSGEKRPEMAAQRTTGSAGATGATNAPRGNSPPTGQQGATGTQSGNNPQDRDANTRTQGQTKPGNERTTGTNPENKR